MRITFCSLATLVVCWLTVSNQHAFAQNAVATQAKVSDFLLSYTALFNQGDAAKLAELWTAEADWESTATGESATGREEIRADFQQFFEQHPGAKLTGSIDSEKEVAPGVVCLDGQTTLMMADSEPIHGTFHAVLTRQGDAWRLAKVVESAPPVLESSAAKLEPLEFLVGQWQDEGDGPEVSTTVRWGAHQTFLIRSFTVGSDEEMEHGTQVIGWDPIVNRIRSWSFFSDGSFGSGTWAHSGDEWIGQLTQTLVDATVCSGTQVIRVVDNDTLEVSNVGREIDGEPQPSTPPVTMVRVNDPPASADAGEEN